MSSVELFLVSCGLQGIPLSEVSEALLNDAVKSNMVEIASSDTVEQLFSVFTAEDLVNYMDDLPSLDREKYVLRLKTSAWRRVVFRTPLLKSPAHYIITSKLATEPEGLGIDDLLELIKGNEGKRRPVSIIEMLVRYGVLQCSEDGIYKLDWEPIEEAIENKKPAEDEFKGHKELSQASHGSSQNDSGAAKLEARLLRALDIIRRSKNEVSEEILRKRLKISQETFLPLIEHIKANEMVSLRKNDMGEDIFVIKGDDDAQKRIFQILKEKKVAIISELRLELQRLWPKLAEKSDEEIAVFFQDNQFNVIEVHSHFVPPEIVILDPEMPLEGVSQHETVIRAKELVAQHFKMRLENVFMKDSYFAAFDNGLKHNFRERVRCFYKFITKKAGFENGCFLLDTRALYSMDFTLFASCVPLHYDGLLADIARSCASSINLVVSSDLASEPYKEYAHLFKGLTCGDILSQIGRNKDASAYLSSKIVPGEFSLVLTALVQQNLLKFEDSEDLYYFHIVDHKGKQAEKQIGNISSTADSSNKAYLSRIKRMELFGKLKELPVESFVEKANELFKAELKPEVRKIYLSLLDKFVKTNAA